jgi:serine phosphatase RsbU (regulator of sigma subunit)
MADGRFMRGASVHNLKVRSMMCAPLLSEDEMVGVIYVDTTRPGQRFVEDDLELLTGISAQAGLAVQNAIMHEQLLTRQRAESDLQFAHKIQTGFLPETPPRIPGYDFAAHYSAAQVVGGDFYDFVDLPNNRLCIVVGDVCGKGIPAALLMAKLMSDVGHVALAEAKPTEAVARLNESFGWRAPEGRFVTLLYLVLDPAARRIECVNAGHPSPIICRGAAVAVDKVAAGDNFPLGLKKNTTFTSTVWELAPGDVMALFTDGVTEAMNANGELYGAKRLEKVLRAAAVPAAQVLTRILNDIEGHVGTVAQSDDLTLVCFGPLAGSKGSSTNK